MTKTLEVVEPRDEEPSAALEVLDESFQGTGLSPGEVALEEELSEHLGYDKHDPVGRNLGDSRNG